MVFRSFDDLIEAMLDRMLEIAKPYMKKIYIAGPMTGYENFNFPAFFAVQKRLEADGWIVFNPANKEDEAVLEESGSMATGDHLAAIAGGFDYKAAYKWDVNKVIEADAIYMLSGWEKSIGARGEHAVAMFCKHCNPEFKFYYES